MLNQCNQHGPQYRQWAVVLLIGLALGACRRDEPIKTADDSTPSRSAGWFTDITNDAGLDFVYESGPYGRLFMPEIMGAGVALVDLDGDGNLDIYLTNGHNGLPETVSEGDQTNRFFRQRPDGGWVDATVESGLGDRGYGMGIAVGDMDNDGDRDVYVTNLGLDRLYRNRGNGVFEDVTEAAGLSLGRWSCSACFFDYDRDGFLDLFVTQYVAFHAEKKCTDRASRPTYCGPLAFPALHDVLLHNNGDGTFTDVSEPAGIRRVSPGAGLGVVCEDLNGDGWIDVYVANDAYANHLWINQRDGTFLDDALLFGTAYNLEGNTEAGMGVVAADFDNDLDLDLFMTHLIRESNTLYQNLGSDGFIDATGESGVGPSSLMLTGFGTVALDVELDGDLDLFVANGRVRFDDPVLKADIPPPWDIYAEPNLFYLNDGAGRFAPSEELAESFCRPVEITRGLTAGDIDRDGDLDILITNIQSPARLYRNDAPRQGHWLAVRAVDPSLRRDALGARILVFTPDRTYMRTITTALGYLSAGEPVAHFGLGQVQQIERIEVRWPDGVTERFPGTEVDREIELVHGQGTLLP